MTTEAGKGMKTSISIYKSQSLRTIALPNNRQSQKIIPSQTTFKRPQSTRILNAIFVTNSKVCLCLTAAASTAKTATMTASPQTISIGNVLSVVRAKTVVTI